MERQMEMPQVDGRDIDELIYRFVVKVDKQGFAITKEFQDELRQNMVALFYLSNDSNELLRIATIYSLVRIFEPVREEKLHRYLNIVLNISGSMAHLASLSF